jgi:hypothetical protein
MAQTNTSSTRTPRTRYANRIYSNGPTKNDFTNPRKETRRITNATNEELSQISLPVGVDADEQSSLKKNYHELVKTNPNIDTVQKWIGKAGDGLNVAKEATGNIFSSLSGITKLGLKKSTSNSTATTFIAGGGSIVAGLLSVKSLISTFKHLTDPKTGSWLLSGIQTILQGGVAVGLGAPFFGKGEKSPFIKRVDGEDVVEVKALLGGVGASLLLGAFDALSKDRLPIISKIPGIRKLAGGIAKDIRSGIDTVTTGQAITSDQGLPGGINANQFGQAA